MHDIPKAEVLRYLGYSGQGISPELNGKIEAMIAKARAVCLPKFTYIVSELEFFCDGIALSGVNIWLTGESIMEYLKGAKKCIMLACTLGTGFETELLRLESSSMTDAVIFDAVGNAYIESYADSLEEELLEKFNGMYSKYRYSPGYGDLPLTLQQSIILALSADKRIGLTATDTDILIPRKSVTAFIGLFDRPQAKPRIKCEACSAKDFCKMRKDGVSCD